MHVLEHAGEHLVRRGKGGQRDVDLLADVRLVAKGLEVLEGASLGNRDGSVFHSRIAVGNVLDEHKGQHVVLVLAGVHAPAKLIAEPVEGAVQIVLPDGYVHISFPVLTSTSAAAF